MKLKLRFAGRAVADLVRYTVRTGHWWMPLLVVTLAAATIAATLSQTVVPTAVYTLF